MAPRGRSAELGARDRQNVTEGLLDRLREQFPELSPDDLARAAVGVAPLPDLHRRDLSGPSEHHQTPRHRA